MIAPPEPKPRVLVIGFGNALRRDDAVGCLIAGKIDGWRRPDIQALAVPQLMPELAASMAAAQAVFFVDARRGSTLSDVQIELLESIDDAAPSMVHTSSPRFLLGLCRATFGRCPPEWLVSVPAVDFSIGEGLSSIADLGMRWALAMLEQLIASALLDPVSRSPCPGGGAETYPHPSPGL